MTVDELSDRIQKALEGTPYELHKFFGDIGYAPCPVPPDNDKLGVQFIVVRKK